MVERWVALVVSAAALALVLWPLTWPPPRDSFPLSSYPMFAHGRRSARLNATYAVAFDAEGGRHWVPPRLVGNREVLQVQAVFERAARSGKQPVAELCNAIAGRVAALGDGDLAGAVEVRILRGSHDAIAFFESGALGAERALARCDVPGRR